MRLGSSALLLILVAAGGCAPTVHVAARPIPTLLGESSPFLIPTLAPGDAWLRHHLILGEPRNALALFDSPRERPASDPLLIALQQSILHREGGELERSNELLEWADREAEKRRVRSATRTAASYLISDRVLSYTPTTTETAMIPYYRMMNYLDLGLPDEAAVEARRISAILGDGETSEIRRCRGDGMLHYLSGLVFEGAGEANDALVSLRRAESDFAACGADDGIGPPAGLGRDLYRLARAAGMDEVADSALARYPGADRSTPADSAEVLVVIERGFIAHRAEEAIHVPLFEDELAGVESDNAEAIAAVAARVTARLYGGAVEGGRWGGGWDGQEASGGSWEDDPVEWAGAWNGSRLARRDSWGTHGGDRIGDALSGAYVLRLVWPNVVPGLPVAALERTTIGGSEAGMGRVADLSALAQAEFEAERAAILTRLVVRGVTKYLVSREVERKAEREGGELLGFIAGRLMNYAANETERADTRSWTLLPEELSIARVTVAPGEVPIGMDVPDSLSSRMPGAAARHVSVRAGERKVVAIRHYPARPADRAAALELEAEPTTDELRSEPVPGI